MTVMVGGEVRLGEAGLGEVGLGESDGDLPPGGVLLGLDPAEVPGRWADAGMSAAQAACNTAAWSKYCWLWEAVRSTADSIDRVELSDRPRPGKIVAASLGVSEGSGSAEIEFARQILVRLPALGEQMRAGRVCERRARIVVSTLEDLDDAQAREVLDRLLDGLPSWGYQKVREKTETTARAVDPGWDELRRRAAIARRRVVLRAAPSGATELCGLDLPREPAQDAHDRILALADTARMLLKRQGLRPGVGPLQADVLMALAGPDGAGLHDAEVVALIVARHGGVPDDELDTGRDDSTGPDDSTPDDRPDGDGGPGGPRRGGPDDGPDDGPDGDGGSDDGPGDSGPEGTDPDPGSHGCVGAEAPAGPGPGGGDAEGPHGVDPGPTVDSPNPDEVTGPGLVEEPGCAEGSTAGGAGRWVATFRARVSIRLSLTTLLGLDRRPGIIPGHGPVTAAEARALAWARTGAPARLLLYRDDGTLDHARHLRLPDPTPSGGGKRRRRRQVVEISAYTREVDDLAGALGDLDLPGLPARLTPGPGIQVGAPFTLIASVARELARARAEPADRHPAVTTADAHTRHPGRALALWVSARDQTCRAPGCQAQAVGADLDHTLDWLHGGLSTADDLGALCRSDHLLKHDPTAGWHLQQIAPGWFRWTAPTGRIHLIGPEPYDPLPEPRAPVDSPMSVPAILGLPGPRAREPYLPRPNRHGHITDAARETARHLRDRRGHTAGDPGSPRAAGTRQTDRYPDEPPF